jgi:putative hydrolase of the HAD superfamily
VSRPHQDDPPSQAVERTPIQSAPETRPIEAVLFDYGHTLIHFDDQPHAKLVDAYENINRLLADTLEREIPAAQVLIERVSRVVDDEIQQDYAAGRAEEVEIATIYERALRNLGFELEPPMIEHVMELEQDGWLNSVHVGPDVFSVLEQLRRLGLRLGVVSNAAYLPRLMKAQLTTLGLGGYFQGVSFSSEVGVRKPHPRIYTHALEQLGVEASQSVFVGDRLREDIQGPKSLGMRAVLTHEWRQEEDPDGADAVIQRLGELPAVLDRMREGRYL